LRAIPSDMPSLFLCFLCFLCVSIERWLCVVVCGCVWLCVVVCGCACG
jgi:hypothetical protein